MVFTIKCYSFQNCYKARIKRSVTNLPFFYGGRGILTKNPKIVVGNEGVTKCCRLHFIYNYAYVMFITMRTKVYPTQMSSPLYDLQIHACDWRVRANFLYAYSFLREQWYIQENTSDVMWCLCIETKEYHCDK